MCSSCAAKQQMAGYALNRTKKPALLLEENQECKYTFEQITNERERLLTIDKPSLQNTIHLSYLLSALNLYSKNCNFFNKKLDEIFKSV